MNDVLSYYRNGTYHADNEEAVKSFLAEFTGGKNEKMPFVFMGNKSDLSVFWQISELEQRKLTKIIPDKRVVVPKKMIESIPDEKIRQNTLQVFAKARADNLVHFDGTAYSITERGKSYISISDFALKRIEAEYKFYSGAEENLKDVVAAEKEDGITKQLIEIGVDQDRDFPGRKRITIDRESLSAHEDGNQWIAFIPGTGRSQQVAIPDRDVIVLNERTIVAFIDDDAIYSGIGSKNQIAGSELMRHFDDRTAGKSRRPSVNSIRKSVETPDNKNIRLISEREVSEKLNFLGIDPEKEFPMSNRVLIDSAAADVQKGEMFNSVTVPGSDEIRILIPDKHMIELNENTYVAFIRTSKLYEDAGSKRFLTGQEITDRFNHNSPVRMVHESYISKLHKGDTVYAPDHFSESLQINKYTVDRIITDMDGNTFYKLKGEDAPDQIVPSDSVGRFVFIDPDEGNEYVLSHEIEVHEYADELLGCTMGKEFIESASEEIRYEFVVPKEKVISEDGGLYRISIPGSQVEQVTIPSSDITEEGNQLTIAVYSNRQYDISSGAYRYSVTGEGLAKLSGVNVKAAKQAAVAVGAATTTSSSVNASIAAAPVPEVYTMGAKAIYAAAAQTVTTIIGETAKQSSTGGMSLTQNIGTGTEGE